MRSSLKPLGVAVSVLLPVSHEGTVKKSCPNKEEQHLYEMDKRTLPVNQPQSRSS